MIKGKEKETQSEAGQPVGLRVTEHGGSSLELSPGVAGVSLTTSANMTSHNRDTA